MTDVEKRFYASLEICLPIERYREFSARADALAKQHNGLCYSIPGFEYGDTWRCVHNYVFSSSQDQKNFIADVTEKAYGSLRLTDGNNPVAGSVYVFPHLGGTGAAKARPSNKEVDPV